LYNKISINYNNEVVKIIHFRFRSSLEKEVFAWSNPIRPSKKRLGGR